MRIIIALIALASAGRSQSEMPPFEVASVKQADPAGHGKMAPTENGFTGSDMPLRQYIAWTWDTRSEMIVGPDWMSSLRFDIVAKAPERASLERLHAMMRGLLKDRFHLSAHWERRRTNVLTLTVAKNGSRNLERSRPDGPASTVPGFIGPDMIQHWVVRNATMTGLAFLIGKIGKTEEPVIDSTGLEGQFNVTIDLPVQQADMSQDDYQISLLFPAIEKQLGLKVKSLKAATNILIIDRLEKTPKAN